MKIQYVVALVLTFGLFTTGCGGMMNSIKSAQMAMSEPASLEVSVDRIEDIYQGLLQVDQLLFRTPIDENSAWVQELAGISQPAANAFLSAQRASGPYSVPKRNVPGIKVYRLHTQGVLERAAGSEARFPSVIDALGALAGAKGLELGTAYREWSAERVNLELMRTKIDELEDEGDRKGTTDARKTEIEAETATIEAAMEGAETQLDTRKAALSASAAQLGAVRPAADQVKLAGNVFLVLQHIARIELESATAATMVVIQAPQAIPGLPGELTELAKRWLKEMVTEIQGVGAQFDPSRSLKIGFSKSGVELNVEGLPNSAELSDRLFSRVSRFYNQVMSAPGRASDIAGLVGFQAEILSSLATGFAAGIGREFVETAGFVIQ
jgi:hypothetical protein